jgi:hypothetical protein
MAFAALVSSFGRPIRGHSGRKRGVGSLGIILESIGAPQGRRFHARPLGESAEGSVLVSPVPAASARRPASTCQLCHAGAKSRLASTLSAVSAIKNIPPCSPNHNGPTSIVPPQHPHATCIWRHAAVTPSRETPSGSRWLRERPSAGERAAEPRSQPRSKESQQTRDAPTANLRKFQLGIRRWISPRWSRDWSS